MYYDFAIEQPGTALIVGHTHRMVVDTDGQAAAVQKAIGKFRRVLESRHFRHNPAMEDLIGRKIEYLEDRYQAALAAGEHWAGPELPRFRPSYFNTGCCAYDNGNVSCLEIADGELRGGWCADGAGSRKCWARSPDAPRANGAGRRRWPPSSRRRAARESPAARGARARFPASSA